MVKAGGIDLLDLMKEGLLQPRAHRQPARHCRARPHRRGQGRHPAHRRPGRRSRKSPSNPLVRAALCALADAAGDSASPQIRNVATLGGNLLQRPRCWYFRSAQHHCARKGGEPCFAFGGENQYHAIFDQHGCAIVHPSTAATALVALGARVELVNAEGARREVLLEDFFVLPDVDIHRENDLKPGEILTAVVLPTLAPALRSVHLKQGEKEFVRLADRRCGRGARSRRGRDVPAGLDRSRSRGAGAASGQSRGGRAARKAGATNRPRGGSACGARGRRAAHQECLQAADFRDAGAARHSGRRSGIA